MNFLRRIQILVVFLMFLPFSCLADGYYYRHYHIVVDQTPDIQSSIMDKAISELLKELKAEFDDPGGKLYFDPATDEMSLYVFGLSGCGSGDFIDRRTAYGNICYQSRLGSKKDVVYDLFVKSFIQPRANFSTSGLTADEFFNKKVGSLFFTRDALAKEISQKSCITLSKYVYPTILEHISDNKVKPSVDDILIVITNYQSGAYDLGTSEDVVLLGRLLDGDRFNGPNSIFTYFNTRFNQLEEPFYRVQCFRKEFRNSNAEVKTSHPVIDANRLALKSLEGVKPHMTSNLSVKQTKYKSSVFVLDDVEISFNHDDDLIVENVILTVSCDNEVLYEEQIANHQRYYSESEKKFKFPVREIDLGKSFNEEDNIKFDYTFYTMVDLGQSTAMSKVFAVTRDFEFAGEHIVSLSEDRTTIIISIVVALLILLIAFVISRAIWQSRGRNCKISANIIVNPVSNERFLRVKNNRVTNLDCWYWDNRSLERNIAVYIDLSILHPSFSKQYEYKVEAQVQDMDANFDFTFKPSPVHRAETGVAYQVNDWVPVDIVNNRAVFNIVAYFDAQNAQGNTPNFDQDNILKMRVSVRVKRIMPNNEEHNMILQNGTNVVFEDYSFIVRPQLKNSNLWVAFDPGTSGSCIAYGVAGSPTDTNDLFVAENTAETLRGTNIYSHIFPSLIRINRDSKRLANDRPVEELVDGIDFHFGNRASILWGNFNCFQSIKKLLGYSNGQKIIIRDGVRDCIKEISGKDLAYLIVKGLCNNFDKYLYNNPNVDKVARAQFVDENDNERHLAVERAIVAVPNSYTLDKIQDMVDSVDRTNRFKEVHYIYESEAVFMTYLRENWQRIGALQHDRIFIVYDMGGATINITAFKLKVDLDNQNNVVRVYVATISKIGYTIGGDDIDYALIQTIYGLPTVQQALSEKLTLSGTETFEDAVLKHQQTYKEKLLTFVRNVKLEIIDRKLGRDVKIIQDPETFYGHITNLFSECDVKLEEYSLEVGTYLSVEESRTENVMHKYVLSQVGDAINELLMTLPANESKNLELIFSGRSVLYPRVKHTVRTMINNHKYVVNEWDGLKVNGIEDSELVKTAVAKGACWFGMYNSQIRLDHSILTTTLGYIDSRNAKETFVPLLTSGTHFEGGKLVSEAVRPIFANLKDVRFVQMMGADHDNIWHNNLSHKFSLIDRVRQNQLTAAINTISMHANDCGEVGYDIRLMTQQSIQENLNDAMRLDITDDNSPAYIFATTNANVESKANGDNQVELYEVKDNGKINKINKTNNKKHI